MELASSFLESDNFLPVSLTGMAVILSATYYYFFSAASTSKKRTTKSGYASSSSTNSANDASNELKNVWDAPRNTPSLIGKKDYGEEKPFGSKYYYAHNNSKSTGGYKDGLKLEDYTMNGPRLLSKGGNPISTTETSESDTTSTATVISSSMRQKPSNSKIQTRDPNLIPITKYLWDDPGDPKGIATIRIDLLPTKAGSLAPLVDYSAIYIGEITANLAGEGLVVQLMEEGDNVDKARRYQLKIPKLYGDAASVKVVRKTKRLLVKIQKKQTALFSPNKNQSNMDAWPQPHRKI